MCFYSIFNIALSDQQILSLLGVKASMVGVRSHLRMLQKRGKITQLKDSLYVIKKLTYPPQSSIQKQQFNILKNTKRSVWLVKLLPFIKSIVVTSDYLLDEKIVKLPKLVIVCSPNRIYLVMTLLSTINKFLDAIRPNTKRPFADPMPMFFTTSGFSFVDQIGFDQLSRVQWFVYCQPVYGENVWEAMLKKNGFIHKNLPNFDWKKQDPRYVTSFSQILDNYDNKKYRQWLRKMAKDNNYKTESALLRVRPDTFIARENHFIQIKESQETLSKNNLSI
jgi:hypothetical protein